MSSIKIVILMRTGVESMLLHNWATSQDTI